MKLPLRPAALLFGLLACAAPALAADAALNTGDTAWVLVSSALVLLMLPGLGFFYAGMVRSKNVLSTTMMSVIAMGALGLQWVIFGYSFAFGGQGGPLFGGFDRLFLTGIGPDTLTGTIPTLVFVAFQGMFAIITPALISGSMVERTKFSTYIVFILLWATLVYDPLAHWVWGKDGWLATMGVMDFAGGIVVHISAGASALAAALVLGPRRGYPKEHFVPHNLTLTLLGTGLLWFGWFGFNAGSSLGANGQAGVAFMSTNTAAAAGLIGWLIAERIKFGKMSALGAASGCIAGLGAITPGAGFITPAWAIVVGLVSGTICFWAVCQKTRLGYDDTLDVFGVHGVGGFWGTLAVGLFATVNAQSLVTGNSRQFLLQLLGAAVAAVYGFVVTYILCRVLDAVMGLRVEDANELRGLDHSEHGEAGYSL
jgi:Amt family ammonium transporter